MADVEYEEEEEVIEQRMWDDECWRVPLAGHINTEDIWEPHVEYEKLRDTQLHIFTSQHMHSDMHTCTH